MTRGTIQRQYVVLCGKCGNTQDVDGPRKHDAEIEARQRGWSKNGKYGWLCPVCAHIARITRNSK